MQCSEQVAPPPEHDLAFKRNPTTPVNGKSVPLNGERVHFKGEPPPLAAATFAARAVAAGPDKMQSARFEYKYIITELKARHVRDIVASYLPPDRYTNGREGVGYYVHSLYLDSIGHKTYWDTENGNKNRFKLRIRFYDDQPDSPCFLEVKRRTDERMAKTRAGVTKASAERLCRTGVLPTERDLIKVTPSNLAGLENFCNLCVLLDARPAAYTSYLREGYEPKFGNYERVTLDRDIRGAPFNGNLSIRGRESWKLAEVGGVVLELKFTDIQPPWMCTLAEMCQLSRSALPKYVRCLQQVNRRLSSS